MLCVNAFYSQNNNLLKYIKLTMPQTAALKLFAEVYHWQLMRHCLQHSFFEHLFILYYTFSIHIQRHHKARNKWRKVLVTKKEQK